MATITFDTLQFVQKLRNSGIESKQAEAVKDSHINSDIATKKDLLEMENRLSNRVISVGILQFALIAALILKLIP